MTCLKGSGSGFGIWLLGSGAEEFGVRVFGFRVWALGYPVVTCLKGSGPGFDIWVLGSGAQGFRVWGFGCEL